MPFLEYGKDMLVTLGDIAVRGCCFSLQGLQLKKKSMFGK